MHELETTLPHAKAVRDMLLELLGREIEVAMGGPWAPTVRDPGTVGVFTDDRSKMRALVSFDLSLSAHLGAAIALIPVGSAEECIELKSLTEVVGENLYEILNILGAIFNVPGRPHLRLYSMHAPGEMPAADVSASLRGFGNRLDLAVDVAGYGGGRMSVVVV